MLMLAKFRFPETVLRTTSTRYHLRSPMHRMYGLSEGPVALLTPNSLLMPSAAVGLRLADATFSCFLSPSRRYSCYHYFALRQSVHSAHSEGGLHRPPASEWWPAPSTNLGKILRRRSHVALRAVGSDNNLFPGSGIYYTTPGGFGNGGWVL